ncbi:MAG: isoprenylcysteine carboxylmethyltransferase family protein [Chloroflexi bacterium]|nr:isoprenylcysteine carboxylmethyltransferase family protein [Chloroflexota bacterium]
MSTTRLSPQQLRKMVVGRLLAALIALGAIFFLSAGTIRYWEAWVYMAVLLIPMSLFAVYLLRYNPALLERRMKMREVEPQQRRIIAVSIIVLLAAGMLPGLDKRFGWSAVPTWLVLAADVIFLLGYLLFVLTLRENEYAARTVEVEQQQRVITTGPYAIVRHPLYLASILMYGFTPLALGSYWGLVPIAFFPVILIARILNEEKVLLRELPGYAEYCQKVRYRLIPKIW